MHRRARAGHLTAWGATAAVLATVLGCTMPGGGGGGQVPATPDSAYLATCPMDHSGGGMDHSGGGGGMPGMPGMGSMPARLDHDPCDAQQAAAHRLIADTRAAVRQDGLNNLAGVLAHGYISIGDELTGVTHYVKPAFHYDSYELDPHHIEAFAYKNGRIVAAMYILSNGKTRNDIPDIAGNWTMWHDHVLAFRSSNPYTNAYYQLGGVAVRQTAPMLHVWLERNSCGPFAGTDTGNMTGSCHPEIE